MVSVFNLILFWYISQLILCFQDDEPALNFVTSAANLRSHIFHIPGKSKFDVKCKCIWSSVLCTFMIMSHNMLFTVNTNVIIIS